jgi:hypothetical protein
MTFFFSFSFSQYFLHYLFSAVLSNVPSRFISYPLRNPERATLSTRHEVTRIFVSFTNSVMKLTANHAAAIRTELHVLSHFFKISDVKNRKLSDYLSCFFVAKLSLRDSPLGVARDAFSHACNDLLSRRSRLSLHVIVQFDFAAESHAD